MPGEIDASLGQASGDTGQDLGFVDDQDQGMEGVDEGAAGGAEQDPVVQLDGRSYKQSELREFIKGGMMERDYRTKTAALARDREGFAAAQQDADAWQTIQQHPQLMQALGVAISQLLQGGTPELAGEEEQLPQATPTPDDPYGKRINAIEKRLEASLGAYDQRFQDQNRYAWEQYYANRTAYAESQLQTLQEKYPFLVTEEVVAAFRDNPDFNIEDVAKASNDHWQKWYLERQKSNMAQRKQNAQARVAVPAAKSGAPATQTVQPKNWEDATKSALERLKNIGQPFRQ